MRSLAEIEEQNTAVAERMAEIFLEIQRGFVGREDVAAEYAEELAQLLYRTKELSVSLKYFRETARQFLEEDCSGPH
jgi:hypothetical protein